VQTGGAAIEEKREKEGEKKKRLLQDSHNRGKR